MSHGNAVVMFYYEVNKVSYTVHKTPLHNIVNGLNRGVSVIRLA